MSDDAGGTTPEEQRKRKIAADCWKNATRAMSTENWDYAIQLFTQAVQLSPDNLVYRQSLRGVEYKKYKNNKSGASMAFLKLTSIRGKLQKAKMQKAWKELDKAAEEGLAVNPWDAQFNADLGEACRRRGFLDVAIYAYERASETAPDNKDYLRALGELLEEKGDYPQAAGAWDRITKLDPYDGKARSKVTALSTMQTIKKGNYEDAKSTKEIRLGYEASVKGDRDSGDRDLSGPGVSTEQDLIHAIRREPRAVENYMKLADYYRREGKLEKAKEHYDQAFDIKPDPSFREQSEDVELDLLRRGLEQAKAAVRAAADDEEVRARSVAMAQELIGREIEIFTGRIERYPADMRLKYELAQRHMRVKQFNLAIPLLQQASKDPRLEVPVLLSLGRCFLQEKRGELALRQYQRASEKINSADQPDQFRECHYMLGWLFEQQGKLDLAERHYSEVLAVDYGYKDVRERIERLQTGDTGAPGGTAAIGENVLRLERKSDAGPRDVSAGE